MGRNFIVISGDFRKMQDCSLRLLAVPMKGTFQLSWQEL